MIVFFLVITICRSECQDVPVDYFRTEQECHQTGERWKVWGKTKWSCVIGVVEDDETH